MSNDVICRVCGAEVSEHGDHHRSCPDAENAMRELRERIMALEDRVDELERFLRR